jgi:hypothetical protein
MDTNATVTTGDKLPPLDNFTRPELEDLIGVLHGALLAAQRDFLKLTEAVRIATERAA